MKSVRKVSDICHILDYNKNNQMYGEKSVKKIMDAGLVYLFCAAMILSLGLTTERIIILLLLFIAVCAALYFKDQRISAGIGVCYTALAIFVPEGIYGFPVAVYALCGEGFQAWEKKNSAEAVFAAAAGVLLCILAIVSADGIVPGVLSAFWLLAIAAAVYLHGNTYRYNRLSEEFIRTKDNDREYSRALKMKNRYLIEKQDAQIYSATLKERNRIAREIHDNVGHMLSRCLLQTGAVLAVNKDSNLEPLLLGIKETLNSAMSSIRSSVHDLHNESVDLDNTIQEMLAKIDAYTVHYEYDMSSELSRDLKYCIISVVKEALANITTHSNADRVELVLREHPAFYQILIQDNGKCVRPGDGTGIGITNMRERVEAFAGTIDIDAGQGFRIFIHIPKK